MNMIIIFAVIGLVILIGFIALVRNFISKLSGTDTKSSSVVKHKDRHTIIKQANKKLATNPKDANAISELANLYYSEEDYEKAVHLFKLLIDQFGANTSLDEVDISYKYAVSAQKTGKIDEAYKYLNFAKSKNNGIFEINFNLGVIEFDNKNYEKALSSFLAAKKLMPEHSATLQYIGQILFLTGKFKEAIQFLRKTYEVTPGNKDVLFSLGQCYNESGSSDNAAKIFSHLRPDPKYGPVSCLESGRINLKKKDNAKAIEDFEIGLKHIEMDLNVRLELLYLLGTTLIKENKVNTAIKFFDSILRTKPDYKDTAALKAKYSELSANKNLKTYLMSPTSEFVNLCKRIAPVLYPKDNMKLTDIKAAKNDYVDIVAEVTGDQTEDVVLFRFIRNTTPVGDVTLRDLYFRGKDVKAGQSYCFTAGSFTESAVRFVESRTIDLISDKKFLSILNKASKES